MLGISEAGYVSGAALRMLCWGVPLHKPANNQAITHAGQAQLAILLLPQGRCCCKAWERQLMATPLSEDLMCHSLLATWKACNVHKHPSLLAV